MDKIAFNPHTEKAIRRIAGGSAHAIGLFGESGSGKKFAAEYIAAKSLGIEYEALAGHPYMLKLDCKQKVSIDDIRGAIEFLTLKIPGKNRFNRTLIFFDFEYLSLESQNALLKSIEEPPLDTLIIITTATKSSLLPTTVSRMSWISVKPVSLEQALDIFSSQYNQPQVAKAYALSQGKIGLMADLLKEGGQHPLAQSISQAKELIVMDKFMRLSQIDSLNKDKDFNLELFLDSLKKIIEASLKNEIRRTNRVNTSTLNKLIKINQFQNNGKYLPNQKILLTDVLYSL